MRSYLEKNPDIVAKMGGVTGLTKDKILEYATYGSGLTIVIGRSATRVSASDYRNKEISFESVIGTALEGIGNDSKLLATYSWATLILVLHELGHYGDRQTNNNHITGQPDGDKDASGNVMPGKQGWSFYGHRGTDVEEYILNNGAKPRNSAYLGFAHDDKGMLDDLGILNIQNSIRFSESLVKLGDDPSPTPTPTPSPSPAPAPPQPPPAPTPSPKPRPFPVLDRKSVV